jgi:hypothetical protein
MLPACRATIAHEMARTVQPHRHREFKKAWLDEPDGLDSSLPFLSPSARQMMEV